MKKFNIIFHITTSCNYDCSYCDVIKDKKNISSELKSDIVYFMEKNKKHIDKFKFFWWEPLLAQKNIEYIINSTKSIKDYEMVTNTSLLNDTIWKYFSENFKIIFFSIDTENDFDYSKVKKFIDTFELKNKVYFNLVINPGSEKESLKQFQKLYNLWFRWFNILPIYFTKIWSKDNLLDLTNVMKYILDLSITDKNIKLYGFMENLGYDTSLINNSIFIDNYWKIYYSDIVSTFLWKSIKRELYLWDIKTFDLECLDWYLFKKEKNAINELEKALYLKVKWQKELHNLMDYFSVYLNKESWNI